MPRPRLQLVHSKPARSDVVHRRRDSSVRLLVIQGARAKSAPGTSPWEAGLELINLGFLASCRSYLAFLQASVAVLEACGPTGSRFD
jgi:hypothetical protein